MRAEVFPNFQLKKRIREWDDAVIAAFDKRQTRVDAPRASVLGKRARTEGRSALAIAYTNFYRHHHKRARAQTDKHREASRLVGQWWRELSPTAKVAWQVA